MLFSSHKKFVLYITSPLAITFYAGLSGFSLPAEHVPQPQTTSISDQVNLDVIFTPPDGDAPKETRGGGTRGSCAEIYEHSAQGIMGLIPDSNYGLTLADHPTFFVYIPETDIRSVFFSLKDETGAVHYEAFVPVSGNAGILQLEIPDEIPPLEVGAVYQWGVALPCSGRIQVSSPFITGWVKRITIDDSELRDVAQSSSLAQAFLYGEHGIWYDMIATLAGLRQLYPDDTSVISGWENVLNSVELESIAPEPFVDMTL